MVAAGHTSAAHVGCCCLLTLCVLWGLCIDKAVRVLRTHSSYIVIHAKRLSGHLRIVFQQCTGRDLQVVTEPLCLQKVMQKLHAQVP